MYLGEISNWLRVTGLSPRPMRGWVVVSVTRKVGCVAPRSGAALRYWTGAIFATVHRNWMCGHFRHHPQDFMPMWYFKRTSI